MGFFCKPLRIALMLHCFWGNQNHIEFNCASSKPYLLVSLYVQYLSVLYEFKQTSGGTVLSTNWKDVKEKDYEGKDKVLPDGFKEVKK
jgi:hypothetical protein